MVNYLDSILAKVALFLFLVKIGPPEFGKLQGKSSHFLPYFSALLFLICNTHFI